MPHPALRPSSEQLLAEVEDLLRTIPAPGPDANNAEGHAWMGRAQAVMSLAAPGQIGFATAVRAFTSWHDATAQNGLRDISIALHQAQYALRIQTSSTGTAAKPLAKGAVLDYFDEVRKIVEKARTDLFFVDPYLDVDFVSRYLPQVKAGTAVRLLSRENITALLPAVELARVQHGLAIEVRYAQGFHDRWVFVDGVECYYSGASFSAGAKKAPTVLAPLIDGLQPVKATYEGLWNAATIK
jgi:hypothetical protein